MTRRQQITIAAAVVSGWTGGLGWGFILSVHATAVGIVLVAFGLIGVGAAARQLRPNAAAGAWQVTVRKQDGGYAIDPTILAEENEARRYGELLARQMPVPEWASVRVERLDPDGTWTTVDLYGT